jgi:uncharacterized protein (TIGR03437 family)
MAQPFFYARDFQLSLQFQPGRDIWVESPGIPMTMSPDGTYIAGTFQISGLVFQGFLRKYDSSGKEAWTRQIAAADYPFLSAVAADATSVYLAGSIGFGHSEMFVRKYDGGGTELWSRQLRISDGYHIAAGMAIDPSGLYVAAWDGRNQGLVRKYSPSGDELWSRSITLRSLRGLSLNNGVYVAGVNDSGGFVSKFGTGGEMIWSRLLNSNEGETVVPAAVAGDSSGVYLAGTVFTRVSPGDITFVPSTGEAFLRKLDGNGAELWARRFATSNADAIVSLAVDQGAVYAAGSTGRALPGQCKAGGTDVFVRKYDSGGVELWTRQFGTSGYDSAGNLAVDSTGVYLSGGVRGQSQAGAFIVRLGKTQSLPADTRPAISWECVVNSASYAGGGVAPNEIVTIFGQAMGPPGLSTFRLGADGTVSTMLSDTRVLFNGVAAPLLNTSASQVSAIVPRSVGASSTTTVEVEYRGIRSEVLTVPVALTRPGIFTTDGSGSGQGAILNEDGTINSPKNPAAKGSVIAVYFTGGGQTDPTTADGAILTGAPTAQKQPIAVFFDDPAEEGTISPAEILFAGGVPQSVDGLLQVNARIPPWVRPSDGVRIYLQAGSGTAEIGVTVAVR